MKIINLPNPLLRQNAKPLSSLSPKIMEMIKEMIDTLINQKNPSGVGLAAPQIGESLQIFLILPPISPVEIFINPKIIKITGIYHPKKGEENLEGCLSVPGYYGTVKRGGKVIIEFIPLSLKDLNNPKIQNLPKPITKTYTGFPAVIIQHEMDHLEGHLYLDRVLAQKGKLYKLGTDSQGKEILDEVNI